MLNEEQLARLAKKFNEEILPVIIANEDKFNEFTEKANNYLNHKEKIGNEAAKETYILIGQTNNNKHIYGIFDTYELAEKCRDDLEVVPFEVYEIHSLTLNQSYVPLDNLEPEEYTPIKSYHIENFKHMYFSLREDKEITKTHIDNVMDELSTIYDEVTGIDLSLEEAESCDDC
jgi:hypothetical protein